MLAYTLEIIKTLEPMMTISPKREVDDADPKTTVLRVEAAVAAYHGNGPGTIGSIVPIAS